MRELVNMTSMTKKGTSMSHIQDRWIEWQKKTWERPIDQHEDLHDADIPVGYKTVIRWRKGHLPSQWTWALIRAFGWPLLITLFGDVLSETYALEQADYARRQLENKTMAKALLSLVDRNTDKPSGDSTCD